MTYSGHEPISSSRSLPCGSNSAYSGARRLGLAYAAQTASCRIWLSRHWPRWKSALVIVKPETVLRWHREGYRRYWRWKSRGKPGRPRIPRRHIAFIRRISSETPHCRIPCQWNPAVGATGARSQPKPGRGPDRPRDGHDNDGIFGQYRCRAAADGGGRTYRCALDRWLQEILGVTGLPTPYGAPNSSAHVERLIGSLRRECLVHFVFLSERHPSRSVAEYVAWYNGGRGHQGIADIPDVAAGRTPPRQPPPGGQGRLVSRPVLGGLAHDYELAA